jgi:hypothetical protein
MAFPDKNLICAFFVLCLASGCSATGTNADAGLDGQDDANDEKDGGDVLPADIDLGDDFGLWIPADSQACPLGHGRVLEDQLKQKLRIRFKPGFILLSNQQDTFEADLIDTIELNPDSPVAVPTSAGEFNRSTTGSPQDGTVVFSYEQTFDIDQREFLLSARFVFEIVSGQTVQPLLVLDSPGMLAMLSTDPDWLKTGYTDDTPSGYYCSCDFSSFRINEYEFTFSDGAGLLLEEWMVEVPGWMMFCAAGLARATYTRDSSSHVADDFWQLAYVPGNHNIIEFFAFRLDPPQGDIHALRINTQSLGMPLAQLSSIFTLDANLETMGELDISEAVYRGVPCFMTD